jgi:hypothetical protein
MTQKDLPDFRFRQVFRFRAWYGRYCAARHSTLSAPNRGHEVNLAWFRQFGAQTARRDLAVDGDGDVGANAPFVDQSRFNAGEKLLQRGHDFADRRAFDFDDFLPTREITMEGRNPHVMRHYIPDSTKPDGTTIPDAARTIRN